MTFPRCERCPIAPGKPGCIVERQGHRRFCEWAASGDERKIARVRELSAVDSIDDAVERAYASSGTGPQSGGCC